MGANKQQHKQQSKSKNKQDSFARKEWKTVHIPSYLTNDRKIGFTVSAKTSKGKVPLDFVGDRIWETSYGNIQKSNEGKSYIVFKWKSVAASESEVYTQFAGMRVTNDKKQSILRKYRTLIDASSDVKSPDGYQLRVFCMCFTDKPKGNKKHYYAQQNQCKEVRRVIIQSINKVAGGKTIKEITNSLVKNEIETEINNQLGELKEVRIDKDSILVTKVKVLRAPKLSPELKKSINIPDSAYQGSTKSERPVETQ